MSFLKKLFGDKEDLKAEEDVKKESSIPEASKENPTLPWIEADKNPWGLRLVDLRPITLNMISSSKDPLAAKNAVSYNGEDGSSFRGIKPENAATVETTLSFVTDGRLEAGVLFMPNTMEHKWAIFFDGSIISFVRSWQRKVVVTAMVTQQFVDGPL